MSSSSTNRITPEGHPIVISILQRIVNCRAAQDIEATRIAIYDAALFIGGSYNKPEIINEIKKFDKETSKELQLRYAEKGLTSADRFAHVVLNAREYINQRNTEAIELLMTMLSKNGITIIQTIVPVGKELGY